MPIPVNFSTPARVSAKNRAYTQILEWIIDGTLQPQEKLNDADLAHALGVSRTPIREALQLLNVQGFVEMFPGVGTQVTPVNKEDILKILPPLAALQALATEIAAEVINQKTIRTLRLINTQFAEAVNNHNFHLALKLDEQFHQIIIETTDNPYILNTVSTLQSHVRRLYFHKSIILRHESINEHEAILRAFDDNNKELAANIARENWLYPMITTD